MRLRAPHSSFPTGDARRVATLDPSAASAGASRTAIPRAALGLFIALSLAACTVPGPLSKAQTDRLTSPDLAVRSSQLTQAAAARYDSQKDVFHPVVARHGMVATEQALASQVGVDILKAGGNAIDAAVAVGFALAVVLPNAGNIGGGGFMMVHDARSGQYVALDFRETAPASATRTTFQDAKGNVIDGKSLYTHAAVGVPGTVAGLTHAQKKWGRLSLAKVMASTVVPASKGVSRSRGVPSTLMATTSRDFSNHVVPVVPAGTVCSCPSMTSEISGTVSPSFVRYARLCCELNSSPVERTLQERARQSFTAFAAIRAR